MDALSAYQMRMRLSATTARIAWSRASSHFSLLSFSTCCSFWRRCPSASASSASFRNSPTAAHSAWPQRHRQSGFTLRCQNNNQLASSASLSCLPTAMQCVALLWQKDVLTPGCEWEEHPKQIANLSILPQSMLSLVVSYLNSPGSIVSSGPSFAVVFGYVGYIGHLRHNCLTISGMLNALLQVLRRSAHPCQYGCLAR